VTLDDAYEQVREAAQATLDNAGFTDVIVEVGYVLRGDKIRPEIHLKGGADRVAQARKLLPFADNLSPR
jgi:hypothetical protein